MAETASTTGDDGAGAAADDTGGTRLLPRSVRRWVVGGLALVIALAAYLIAVRGTAILFDLSAAVSALCM